MTLSAAAGKQTIIFFGDSIAAGMGLEDPDLAYPGVIEQRIEKEGLPFRVVNAGLSGETSAGGLRRVDWILRQPCDVFVLELGANDGLRGLNPNEMKLNLIGILGKVHSKYPKAALVVAGMEIFPSMGEDYREGFESVFPEVAEITHAVLIPFLLENVGGVPSLNQADGIHPTVEGHRIVADNVWQVLEPLLKQRAAAMAAK